MRMGKTLTSLFSVALGLLTLIVVMVPPATAATVVLSGSGPGNYSITLDPLTFTITNDGCCGTIAVPNAVVIKDFFTATPGVNGMHVSGSIDFSRNGTTWGPFFHTVGFTQGIIDLDFGGIGSKDLYIAWGLGSPFVNNNDTVTISTSNLVFSSTVDLSPIIGPPGTYTALLLENSGIMASANVNTVPIPAAAWLFGSALLGLGAVKRRKA